jgi:hypothetical protein
MVAADVMHRTPAVKRAHGDRAAATRRDKERHDDDDHQGEKDKPSPAAARTVPTHQRALTSRKTYLTAKNAIHMVTSTASPSRSCPTG